MFIACSRCTGYRPILDAFRVFAKGDSAAYTEEAIAASKAAAKTNGVAHKNGSSNGAQSGNGHSNGSCNDGHNGCNGKTNGSAASADAESNGQSAKTNGKVCHLPVQKSSRRQIFSREGCPIVALSLHLSVGCSLNPF